MHDELPSTKSQLWLARQLRDAARREAPAFSESLHQRIMQAVRPTVVESSATELLVAPQAESPNGISRRRSSWRGAALLTAVAAAIFAMVVAARQFVGPDNGGGSQPAKSGITRSVAVEPAPTPQQATGVVPSKPVETNPSSTGTDEIASLNYTLDDLTRDAQATAHLLVDQLPFETPADEWGL